MIVVVTGSRTWRDEALIYERLAKLPPEATIIVGGARGADRIAERIARAIGLRVIVVRPLWRVHGQYNPRAGFERNTRMLDMGAVLVLGFWDGKSNGTRDCLDKALAKQLTVEVFYPRRNFPGGKQQETLWTKAA